MIGLLDGNTWEYFNDPSYFYAEVVATETAIVEKDGKKTS
jgi:hypothetical protein